MAIQIGAHSMSQIMGTKPLRATFHCRHYQYVDGPKCAVECDMTAPRAALKCLPSAIEKCPKREEFTEHERAEWDSWKDSNSERHTLRISGIDKPIPCNHKYTYLCPCGKGKACAERGIKRVYVNCSCDLGQLQLNIGHSKQWPKNEDSA